jgi:hypothetical protein
LATWESNPRPFNHEVNTVPLHPALPCDWRSRPSVQEESSFWIKFQSRSSFHWLSPNWHIIIDYHNNVWNNHIYINRVDKCKILWSCKWRKWHWKLKLVSHTFTFLWC